MPKVTVEQHRRFRDLLRKNIYPQQVTSVFRTHLLSFSETILECAADALADQTNAVLSDKGTEHA